MWNRTPYNIILSVLTNHQCPMLTQILIPRKKYIFELPPSSQRPRRSQRGHGVKRSSHEGEHQPSRALE